MWGGAVVIAGGKGRGEAMGRDGRTMWGKVGVGGKTEGKINETKVGRGVSERVNRRRPSRGEGEERGNAVGWGRD